MATITQGDFSVFGNFETRWSGRWGEGSDQGGTFTTFNPDVPGRAPSRSGGSFDFNHWDLVQARQVGDIRPDYHFVKNYNFLGRFDTMILKDADFFGVYMPWYDAFPDIKHLGTAQPGRDWFNYSTQDRIQQFTRDDLREYYGQLNFTDNFSMRVGKQQVIWSEADALSGTDVTNPADLRYHWNNFESPEDQRINLRMIKFNYILPDFWKTANNELDFFVIPGDWEGTADVTNTTDARSPYVAQAPLNPGTGFNEEGQPYRNQTLADAAPFPLGFSPALGFYDAHTIILQNNPVNSLDNSEFGVRYSTLLPIGNGLQTSLIYLYEARSAKLVYCSNCPAPFGFAPVTAIAGPGAAPPGAFIGGPIIPPGKPIHDFGPGHLPTGPVAFTIRAYLRSEIERQNFVDLTGTYYDKDLTDIVYRYDFLYTPKEGISKFNGGPVFTTDDGGRWTTHTRWIVAGDRPTYIPWLSKQHTFIVFQNVLDYYPNRPSDAVLFSPTGVGKVRELDDLTFLSFLNWLINGQLTTTNTALWQWTDNVGFLESTNVYRYSRNVLFGINGIMYLGRSGRYTDPFLFSRDQRINELEFTFTYEI